MGQVEATGADKMDFYCTCVPTRSRRIMSRLKTAPVQGCTAEEFFGMPLRQVTLKADADSRKSPSGARDYLKARSVNPSPGPVRVGWPYLPRTPRFWDNRL